MPARIAASPLSRAWLIGSCQFQQRAGLAVTFCRGYTTLKPSVSATSLKPEASPIRCGPVTQPCSTSSSGSGWASS
ncbi:hypothetical protein G6F62_015204 [Rhizopus arrhizus]|nr:hypothetical protein G6F62_015204 [Rhizopus arrhizus]